MDLKQDYKYEETTKIIKNILNASRLNLSKKQTTRVDVNEDNVIIINIY